MRRRLMLLIAAAGLSGHAAALRTQPAGAAVRRIVVLQFGSAPSGSRTDPNSGFRQGLLEPGLVEGRNLAIDYRYADGRPDRLAGLVAELIALKPDVIVVGGPAPLKAARSATRSIPIVANGGADPVAEGWAASLARPGDNVTGRTVTFPELGPKCLELLKLVVPGLARVAVLWAPAEVAPGQIFEAGARALGLQVQMLDVAGPDNFEAAFKRAAQGRAQGMYVLSTNPFVTHRARLATLSLIHRLPAISGFSLLAEAGLLMSYGVDLEALGRRAATYIDKISRAHAPATWRSSARPSSSSSSTARPRARSASRFRRSWCCAPTG